VEGDSEAVARRGKPCRPRWAEVKRRAEGERWGAEMARLAALVAVETETESTPPMRRGGSTASMAGAAACGP